MDLVHPFTIVRYAASRVPQLSADSIVTA